MKPPEGLPNLDQRNNQCTVLPASLADHMPVHHATMTARKPCGRSKGEVYNAERRQRDYGSRNPGNAYDRNKPQKR